MTHPTYSAAPQHRHWALIGDEVKLADRAGQKPEGTIVAIYLDGMVELSTGDQVPASDLVLLRRASA